MIGFFPDPYPDELLYSVCARYSDRVKAVKKRYIVQELFGFSGINAVFDFPTYLDNLILQLPLGHNYTADKLIDECTLFPLYIPFIPDKRVDTLRKKMAGNKKVHIRTSLGNSTGKNILSKWLKFCPICRDKDREIYGETYWHRIHQVLGVEVCPKHNVLLENSSVSTSRTARNANEFISAERVITSEMPRQINFSEKIQKLFLEIANNVDWLLNQNNSDTNTNTNSLVIHYFNCLHKKGLLIYKGNIKRDIFLREFQNFYPNTFLSIISCEIESHIINPWPIKLLENSIYLQNPVHHILLIIFLGYSTEEFFKLHTVEYKLFRTSPWPCLNEVCPHFNQLHIKECHIQRKRYNGKPLGVFMCQLCGFAYSSSLSRIK